MLGVIQFRPEHAAPVRSLERVSELASQALEGGVRLLVLPGMVGVPGQDRWSLRGSGKSGGVFSKP